MTERPTIPEEWREDIETVCRVLRHDLAPSATTGAAIKRLEAALPPKRPTFNDDEALAFWRALCSPREAISDNEVGAGHVYLARLAAAGWTAPPALCPPIPVDEVKKRMTARGWQTGGGWLDDVLDVLRDLNRERGHG